MQHHLFVSLACLALFLRCPNETQPALQAAAALQGPGRSIRGLTLVAPPEPFFQNPMSAVKDVAANWIAVVPYAFTRRGQAGVRYSEQGSQWWGESPAGARETIRLAHEAGIRVMLKPQVYIPGGWTGALDFATDSDWAQWEAGYERYILRMARLADSTRTELFCIGTEFRVALEKRPAFWIALIQKVKKTYKGKLVYSSNWDDWERVPFWNELDYIGLGGYFPLLDAPTPAVADLKKAWRPICERLRSFSKAKKRPVLFTEYGYLSVDGCGGRNWELENNIEARPVNELAQANCLEALLETFHDEPWWAGGFLWKWFPNMRGHEGYPERDYTPQGKIGEATLRKCYARKR